MKSHFSISALAILLTITLVAPSVFLIAPQQVRAQEAVEEIGPNLYTNIKTTLESTISAVKNTITAIAAPVIAAATVAQQVNSYVLQPLAFALSGNLLKSITASVVGFVNGNTNGSGKAQFVTNLPGTLQTVGDTQALAFFARLKGLNSPFAASITSSLTTNYLQNTSMAGFFAANQCTLAKSSPNVNKFLAGDWSQGGVKEWFALTTQNQNNPYTLYQNSQNELASVVSGAQSTRITELNWGQGFESWCGGSSTSSSGDPCTNKDGSPGKIQTPGSIIKSSLDKALGTDQDKLVKMGSTASEINSILGNIGAVIKTAGLTFSVFGGGGTSGGLLGIGNTSSSNRNSLFSQYQSSGFLGTTPSSVVAQNAATLPIGSDMASRISQYQSAWNTISTAANTASTSAATLASYCSSQAVAAHDLLNVTYSGNASAGEILTPFISASNAQATASRTALTTEIKPVLDQIAAAFATIATANAMAQKVQSEQNSITDAASGDIYAADMQTLQTMSPTGSDIASVLQDSQAFGTASANPSGSLTVSGGSLLDKMNLISANANSLKASCDIPVVPSNESGGSYW
ncbi:MAG: hypothetical protein NTU85_00960 [Candidatus Kaiserbacteria bacterium]|nr:hypothetical protein [Candidatus Kaiserbacteria bacterium]